MFSVVSQFYFHSACGNGQTGQTRTPTVNYLCIIFTLDELVTSCVAAVKAQVAFAVFS